MVGFSVVVVSVVVVSVPPVTSSTVEDWKDPKVSVPVDTGEPNQLSCQLSHTIPVTPVSSAISLIASKLLSSFTTISGLLVTSFQSSGHTVTVMLTLWLAFSSLQGKAVPVRTHAWFTSLAIFKCVIASSFVIAWSGAWQGNDITRAVSDAPHTDTSHDAGFIDS